jgi:hypothetical protein
MTAVANKVVKTAKDRAVAQATSRGGVVARPAAALVGELGLSVALHELPSPESLVWMTPALAVSTVGLSALLWKIGRDQSQVGRILAVGSTALTGAHLIASAIVGPFADPLLGLWLWGGGSMAAAWVMRLWVARGNAQVEDTKKQVSLWDQAAKKAGGALEGSAFQAKDITPDRMSGPLQVEPGQTIKDAQMSLGALESVLGLPPGGARLHRDPEHAARGELTLVRTNVLKEKLGYRGPSALGGTPVEPYRMGCYGHGGNAMLPLHIPGQGEKHLIIQGMTGSGKTMGAWQLFAEEFTRRDTYTIYVDTVKGAQSLGPLAGGVRWAIRTEAEAHALMKVLVKKIIPTCAQYLGSRKPKGLKNWEPGCGYPRIRIHIEEGAGLFIGDDAFIRALERARSVGLQVTVSAQRFSYTTIPVAARQQFSNVLCYGVKDIEDAKFAMPDPVFEAGADPSLWEDKHPGMAYLVASGVDEKNFTEPLRVELPTEEEVELLAEYARIHGADLPDWLAEAFGELYTSRVPVEDMLAEGAVVFNDDEDDEDDWDSDDADESRPAAAPGGDEVPEEDQPEPFRPSEEDPEPDVQPGIDDPIEPVEDMPLGVRPVKLPPEQAREMFETRLRSLQEEGVRTVTARHLTPVAIEAGMTPQWVYKQLAQRVDSGHLERTDSGWRFARALTNA